MKFAAFDLETAGDEDLYALQAIRLREGKARITSAAFAVESGDNEIQLRSHLHPTKAMLRGFLNYCFKNNQTICTWNGGFDISWLIALGLREEVMRCKWLDGMQLWKHARICPTFEITKDTPGYGLKEAVRILLPWASDYAKGVTFNPTTSEEWEQLRRYNGEDASYTQLICKMLWAQLTPEQRRVAVIEAACIPMVAETLVEGVKANANAAIDLQIKLSLTAAQAFDELLKTEPTITPQMLASPVQLRRLLVDKWGLLPAVLTEKGDVSTNRQALKIMAVQDPRAELVNTYREARNNATKFADGTIESLYYNGDGYVRPAHRIFGTYTGRMSISASQGRGVHAVATGIPLHQWKRDPEFRRLIEAPPGYDLAEFDFAGQEFRWLAVVSNDSTMLGLCEDGEDAHSFMAASIVHEDYHDFCTLLAAKTPGYKDKRQLGKVANLALGYRTSAKTLMTVAAVQYNLKLTFSEAQKIWNTYQQTYPRVPAYWRRQMAFVKRNNYVVNPMGRRVWLNQPHARAKDATWSYESTAINFPIQSAGACQKYLALMVLKSILSQWGGRFYYELHDGVFCVLPKDNSVRAFHAIKQALSNLPYEKAYGLKLPIKFPVDGKLGPNWGELQEIKC